MKKLDVQIFIENHPEDWEKLLSEKPYCMQISRDVWNGRNLLMLKYSQIDSDFNEKICRECRGIVFDENTMTPVSFPFYKFGNVSEGSWVEGIDWNDRPYVLEKCDGSLIKVVKLGGKLLVSTNGTILAENAPVAEQIGCSVKNFKELFYWALGKKFRDFTDGWFESLFEEGYTYMFELCTPYNRVVVPYSEPKVYFIGIRNNSTFEESYIMDHPLSKVFDTPRVYDFGTFEECIETAKALPWDSEGYVITDRSFKRNKAKSLGYLACHHMKGNGTMSYVRGIELVRLNETDEVIAYFPEFKPHLDEIRSRYESYVERFRQAKSRLAEWISASGYEISDIASGGPNRKDLARFVMTELREFSSFMFAFVDGKASSIDAWIDGVSPKNMAVILGYKE